MGSADYDEPMGQQAFTVRVEPLGAEFCADGDAPLLAAAESVGVVLPSSCRNGTCRTCMCRLRTGSVRYGIEWPGLLAEEKAEGWILPCVAHPTCDLVLEAPAAHVLPVT